MPRVRSSMIRSVKYDKKEKILNITFRNGSEYQYDDVPKTPVTRMLKAASKGRSFHRHIRDQYPTTKLVSGAAGKKKRKK